MGTQCGVDRAVLGKDIQCAVQCVARSLHTGFRIDIWCGELLRRQVRAFFERFRERFQSFFTRNRRAGAALRAVWEI